MKISNKTMAATIAASLTSIQKLLAFCLIIMLFSSFEAKAYDCTHGECGELLPYTSSDPYTVTGGLGGGCFYQVIFDRYYEVCDGDTNYYYKLISIDFFGSPSCNNDAVMQDAIKQLLAYATSNFNLPTNSANFKINVITPECIKKETNGDGVLQILACTDDCCVTEYLMANPVYLSASTSKYTSTAVCSTLTAQTCYYNCTNNDLPEGTVTAFTTPDCSSCTWTQLKSRKYTYGTCQIEVFYQTSVCSGIKSIRIDRILTDGSSGCTYTMNDYIIYAKGKLLRDAAKIFAPIPVNSPATIRYLNSPCWYQVARLIVPCANTNCCIMEYQISNKSNNEFNTCSAVFEILNTSCSTLGACTDNCDATKNIPSSLPKFGHIESEERPIEKNIIKSLVVPNPSKDKCDISLTLENAGALKLLVFDNNGREITELTIANTSSKEVTFNLNTKNFSVGNYQYIITQNDKIISKGNLMIQR